MSNEHNRPVLREDLLFDIEMGLSKARKLWPKRRVPGVHNPLRPIAAAVADHLELSGIRCFRGPPLKCHSTPSPAENRAESKPGDTACCCGAPVIREDGASGY